MTERDYEALEARLARLERLVEALAVERSSARAGEEPAARAGAAPVAPAEPRHRRRGPAKVVADELRGRWDGQLWLNRFGIGLLLLGVALLFRYSIDMGWLTPAVRVGFGAAVGAVLLFAGLRIGERRRWASVLVGGGIATFYLTGFAAFHLYGLIGYALAFALMVGITVLAYGLALAKGEPVLAILGALGGLGTPLILGLSYGSPRGFALYTCLILAWTAALHLYRGWRSVLWTSLAGGWLLLVLYGYDATEELRTVAANPGTLTAAAACGWGVTGLRPLARRVVSHHAPAAHHERHWRHLQSLHWYGLGVLPPHLALVVAGIVLRPATETWGAWVLAAAAAYAAAAWLLRREDPRIARVVLFTSSLLVSVGLVAALDGAALLAALGLQFLAMHWLGKHGGGLALKSAAHKVFLAAAAWVAFRLAAGLDVRTVKAGADVVVIAGAFASSYLLRTRASVLAYRYFAHAALLGWMWRELATFQGGEGYATVAWGAYGLGLLLYAMYRGYPLLEKVAVVTLAAMVAKLFLVDLAALEALYRVLLFLGLGTVFLVLSYWLQGWWKPGRDHPSRHTV